MVDLSTRFEQLIREAPIPYPWDRHEFVSNVAVYRHRPITLESIDASVLSGTGCSTGSGLWIARADDDLILYGADTEWHADHIICHEIGHMLLGHGEQAEAQSGRSDADTSLAELLPSLSLDTIRSVLRRSDYGTDRERDAEMFADLVMVEATLPRRQPSAFRSAFFRARHR